MMYSMLRPVRQDAIVQLIEALKDRSRPPLVMGVINVTDDSFYEGSRVPSTEAAVALGLEMASNGAEILDIGGESTRPGSSSVPVDEEIRRVVPVIRELAARVSVAISVDTRRAQVAAAALEAGAVMVNDVSAFTHDTDMPSLLGRSTPLAIAMHMRGTPADMQSRTEYRCLTVEVLAELWNAVRPALDAGLPLEHLLLDPGIGFAKTWDQNLTLLCELDYLVRTGRPIVVGVSRKSFIGRVLDRPDPADRLFGTAAAVAAAVLRGARVLRVHDVPEMCDVVRVAHAIAMAGGGWK